ncbi:hypothetical protein [Vibrio campbellii]|uniref:hypothetical protein n=1 Tax=Vibrio campbellii TaxID=680 RepID=UPI00210A1EDE|nr:hypothetical protein [Vibrio campbellii]UTZ44604.1 hypothetical protein HB764_25430 [Vibrio campbellii]
MQEIDYRLGVDTEGVIVSEPIEVLAVRVAEWLDTPQGQMWGAPHWGNRLKPYKHEPMNSGTEAAIENSILLTLPNDVKGVVLAGIDVRAVEFDLYRISIRILGAKEIVKEVQL